MKHLRYLYMVLLLGLTPIAEADDEPEYVLFVGNSFTYYNNGLHGHYRDLLHAAHADGLAPGNRRLLTISGGTLPEHAGGLRQMLAGQAWDVVVLQGYSNGPISPEKVGPFRSAARQYAKAIRENGAEPVFFMTWAYSDQPEMTEQLDDAYAAIGAELDAQVVPVGRAFERATKARPDLHLIIADLKHPTLAGSYLAACTFYAALHGRSPEGLAYTAGLKEGDATFLQRVAWETWQDYDAS